LPESQKGVKGGCFLKVDPEFKYRILKTPGGETFKLCYQCGRCTATCPIARFTRDFRPNKLIHMAKLGIGDVLKHEEIWLCATCYACTERCPQGILVTDVMKVLQQLAVEEGITLDLHKALVSNVIKTGFVNAFSASTLKRRESRGLPPLPKPELEDIKKLADATGLTEMTE
jgi:heterodisulfide reductase subunit C